MRMKRNGSTSPARASRTPAPPADAARIGIDQAEPFDLYETPGYLVRRLHQIVVSACHEQWGDLSISPLQYAVLMAVRAFPGIDQRGLARAIAIDRSSVGTVSEQLDRRGFIERRVGTRDKRNKELFLTEAGGHATRWDGSTYRVGDGKAGLLAASNPSLWARAADVLLGAELGLNQLEQRAA